MWRTIWSGIGIALVATGSLQAAPRQESNPPASAGSQYRTVLNRTRVGTYYESEGDQSAYELFGDEALQVRFPAPAGSRVVQVAFLKKTAEPEGLLEFGPRPMEADLNNYKGGDPQVESATITGPFDAKGPGDTPSRRKIFVCHPTSAEDPGSRTKQVSLNPGSPNPGSNDASEADCARRLT